MSRLETQRISRASAEQRAGRAGRTAPGVCYRLWSDSADRSLAAYAAPEIAVADLAPLALDLAAWGTAAAHLRWLDPPPAATLAGARDLLAPPRRARRRRAASRRTAARCIELAAHPRLAHMLLEAREHGARSLGRRSSRRCCPSATCCVAAWRGGRERDSDIRTRLGCAAARRRGDRGVLERVRRARTRVLRELGAGDARRRRRIVDAGCAARVRVSRSHRQPPTGRRRRATSSRTGAARRSRDPRPSRARSSSSPSSSTIASARRRSSSRRRSRASDLLEHFAARDRHARRGAWDARAEAVVARRAVWLGELRARGEAARTSCRRGASRGRDARRRCVRSGSTRCRGTTTAATFVARCEFVRALERGDLGDWPDFSRDALAADLAWLEPYLDGVTRRSHFARVPLLDALRARLTHAQARALDELAPTHITLPTGTRAPHRLHRRQRALRVDAHAGSVRPRRHAAHRRRRACP